MNSGGVSSPRATPLAVRGFTRRRKKIRESKGIQNNFLPSSFPRRQWPVQTVKSQQLVDFSFYFLCFSYLVRFFFRSISFLCLLPSLFVSLLSMEDPTVVVVRGRWSCGGDGMVVRLGGGETMFAVEEGDRGTIASWRVKIGERERGGSLSFLQKRGGRRATVSREREWPRKETAGGRRKKKRRLV